MIQVLQVIWLVIVGLIAYSSTPLVAITLILYTALLYLFFINYNIQK